jgi:hypothetical protein
MPSSRRRPVQVASVERHASRAACLDRAIDRAQIHLLSGGPSFIRAVGSLHTPRERWPELRCP